MSEILSPSPWAEQQDYLREYPPLSYSAALARIAELEVALEKAEKGLTSGCDKYAARTWEGLEVPGDEQYPWVKAMQIGRDAARAALRTR